MGDFPAEVPRRRRGRRREGKRVHEDDEMLYFHHINDVLTLWA